MTELGYCTLKPYDPNSGTYTVNQFITGVSVVTGAASVSPVYSSPSGSAGLYEQIFTQTSDPRPNTVDWMNGICTFEPTAWTHFSANMTLISHYSYDYSTPLFRAYDIPCPNSGLSSTIPVDGVRTDWDRSSWSSKAYYVTNSHGITSWMNSQSGISRTTGWAPISAIAGSSTSTMLAACAIYIRMFGYSSTEWKTSENILFYDHYMEEWAAGNMTGLAPNDCFSGQIQFANFSSTSIV